MAIGLFIPARYDLGAARKDLESIKADAKKAGTAAGQALGSETLKGLRAEMNAKLGVVREALARGLINKDQFRRLSQDAAKEFNSGILKSLEKLRTEGKQNTVEFEHLQRAIKATAVSGGTAVKKDLVDRFSALPGVIKGALGAGVIGAFAFVAHEIVGVFEKAGAAIEGVLERARKSAQIREGFQLEARGTGLDPQKLLADLRAGTRGMLSDIELMQLANRALQSEVPVTEAQFGKLAQLGRRLADVTGGDIKESFGTILEAVSRGQTRVLRQAGIFITLEDALRRWEQATGRSSKTLTDQEQKIILLNAVLGEAEKVLGRVGDAALQPGERLDQLKTAVSNFKDAAFEAIAKSPRLVELLDAIGGSAEGSAGRIQTLANRIGALVDTIIESSPKLRDSWLGKLIVGEAKIGGKIAGRALGLSSDDFNQSFQENLRRRQIETETSETRLLGMKRDNLVAILKLTKDGVAEDDERVRKLEHENYLITVRQKALKDESGKSGKQPTPPPIIPNETLDQLKDLHGRLMEMLSGLTETTVDNARAALDKFITDVKAKYRAAGIAIPQEFLNGFKALQENLDVQGQLQAHQKEVDKLAERTPGVGTVDDLIAIAGALSDESDALDEGSTALKQYKDLYQRVIKLIKEHAAAVKADGQAQRDADKGGGGKNEPKPEDIYQERLDRIRAQARAVHDTAVEAIELAHAFKIVDDGVASVLKKAADLAEQIAAITKIDFKSLFAGFKSGKIDFASLGSILGAAGTAADLIGGLFAESPEDHERKEILKNNTTALKDLAREMAGFRATSNVIGAAVQALQGITTNGTFGALNLPGNGTVARSERERAEADMTKTLGRFGLTVDDLDALAAKYNITLRDSAGRILPEALKQLLDALKTAAEGLIGFANTVDDQRTDMDLHAKIFGEADDAAARLARTLKLLVHFAPDLVKKFGLEGVDATTAEGQKAIQEALKKIFAAFEAGTLDIGNLTREEFLQIIGEITDSLSEAANATGATHSFTKDFTITENTAQRLGGYLATHSIFLSDIRDLDRRAVAALEKLSGVSASIPPGMTPAIGARGPIVSVGAIDLGGVHVQLDATVTAENARDVGERFGDAVGTTAARKIDEALGGRAIAGSRITGRSARSRYAS